MRTILIILFFVYVDLSHANDINNYRFYQTDSYRHEKEAKYAAYILNDDPCIHIKDINKKSDTRFCKINEELGIDLESDTKSIYPYEIHFQGDRLKFFVTAYWNEQKCEIKMRTKEIDCESKNPPQEELPEDYYTKRAKEHEITIPPSVKHIEFNSFQGQGQYRLILNNSEMNPCFTLERYEGFLSDGPTEAKNVCSVKHNNDELNLIKSDGSEWFENFNWSSDSLTFDMNAFIGSYQCELKLPFDEESDAMCIR